MDPCFRRDDIVKIVIPAEVKRRAGIHFKTLNISMTHSVRGNDMNSYQTTETIIAKNLKMSNDI